MALSAALTTRLLDAIETDSLVFLCGAGLSIPSPSYLPSAETVSEICYDKRRPIEVLDPTWRHNVDLLAGYFYAKGDFDIFIHLVPWHELVGPPNKGHAAIADLLISRGGHAALSANFDSMIERWAEGHRVAMQGALTGQEAVEFTSTTNPLIKFHGCMLRARQETLWTQGQLGEPSVDARIQSCSQWMNLHLPGKHLVVVGFWSDWGYLNNVLANAFSISNARSVTVIDPSSAVSLQTKAPTLWAKLNGLSDMFEHVQTSGADALEELRTAYSKTWARRFYELSNRLLHGASVAATVPGPFDGLSCEELYDLRRDAEGLDYTRAARRREPSPSAGLAAYVFARLLSAGARNLGAWLTYGGQSIRIVNGAGQGLNDKQGEYKEPPSITQSDIVVCAGAIDLGVPAKLKATGRGASTVRPSPGGRARWLTLEQAQMELGI